MPALSVCLATLSLSEAGHGRFGRFGRQQPLDIYHTIPYHTIPVAFLVTQFESQHRRVCHHLAAAHLAQYQSTVEGPKTKQS